MTPSIQGLRDARRLVEVKRRRVEEARRELDKAQKNSEAAHRDLVEKNRSLDAAIERLDDARKALVSREYLHASVRRFNQAMVYSLELEDGWKSARGAAAEAAERARRLERLLVVAQERLQAAIRECEKTERQCDVLARLDRQRIERRLDSETDEFLEVVAVKVRSGAA